MEQHVTPDLTTTNVLLGIMAAVSLLEAIAAIGAIAAVFLIYRQATRLLSGIEERQVAPAAARVNAILDDVKGLTSSAKQQAGRVDQVIEWFINFRRRRHAHEQAPPRRVM
jgi:hypothetical protein